MHTLPDEKMRIAVAHFLTLEDPNATEQDILAVIAWSEESAENEALLQKVSRFSNLCDDVPVEDVCPFPRSGILGRARAFWKHSAMWSRALAAMLAFLCVALAYSLITQTRFLDAGGRHGTLEYFTGVGEVKTVLLSDRTKITLGAATGVRVKYNGSTRKVFLASGEAIFDVTKDAGRPFIVGTVDGEITALGTVFSVHRAPQATTVTLVSGRVKAETVQKNDGPVVYMRPNTQVRISVAEGVSPMREVDADSVNSWREGKYRYEDAPLTAIISDLQRYYERPIVLASPDIGDAHFTGAVKLNPVDIEQWLNGLSYISNLHAQAREGMLVISRKPVSSSHE